MKLGYGYPDSCSRHRGWRCCLSLTPFKEKFNFLIIDNTEMNSKIYLKFLEWTINMIYKQNLLAPSHTKIVGHICLYSIGVEICLLFSCSFHQSLLGGAGHQYWGNQEGEFGIVLHSNNVSLCTATTRNWFKILSELGVQVWLEAKYVPSTISCIAFQEQSRWTTLSFFGSQSS